VVNAATASAEAVEAEFVALFADISLEQAEAALNLSEDLGFLKCQSNTYKLASPFCRFLATPEETQKAAVMRIVLEAYVPFTTFRSRLLATADSGSAARETKALLDLDASREDIKNTLLSLGTFSQALVTAVGGKYTISSDTLENDLQVLAQSCTDDVSAERRIREQLGDEAYDAVSLPETVRPLASALLYAASGDARSAVLNAGNAIESFLGSLAARKGVSLAGKNGINAKIDALVPLISLPRKLKNVGKYLGHVRNAADHGATDPDVTGTWTVRVSTGVEYVFVACSFIAAVSAWEKGKPPEI